MAKLLFAEQNRRACLASAAGTTLIYLLAFAPLHRLMDGGEEALVAVPVILMASSRGLRAGVVAGSLGMALNALLLGGVAGHGTPALARPELLVLHALLLVVGGLVGQLGDSYRTKTREVRALQQELAESMQASRALKEREELYRALVDLSPEVVAVQSGGRYAYVNMAGARLLGAGTPAEIIGRPVEEFIHGDYRDRVRQRLQDIQDGGSQASPIQVKGLRLDGQTIDMEMTGAPITYQGEPATQVILRDVTGQRNMEDNLRQRQKLEIVGELAAGVAHEVRNPLSVIQGFSQLLMARQLDEEVSRDVQIILRESQRAIRVVQDLLSFARRDEPQASVVDVTQVLDRVRAVKAYDFRLNHIESELRLKPDLPLVMADEGQLQQVFINIMTNAQQAMADYRGGGSLVISGERVGGNLRLSFADNGPGIAPEHLVKVFDPFFTTKEADKGTGLGLSVSCGIVANHGGQIWAESEAGKGATFYVELPGMPGHRPGEMLQGG